MDTCRTPVRSLQHSSDYGVQRWHFGRVDLIGKGAKYVRHMRLIKLTGSVIEW